nr:hypothetical protein [Mycoplasma haemocanis]
MLPSKKILSIVGLLGATSSLSVVGASVANESAKTLQKTENNGDNKVSEPKFEVSPRTAGALLSKLSPKEGNGYLVYGQFPELEEELLSKMLEDLSSQEALDIVNSQTPGTGKQS